jgi:hypothetical protein
MASDSVLAKNSHRTLDSPYPLTAAAVVGRFRARKAKAVIQVTEEAFIRVNGRRNRVNSKMAG